MWAEWATHGYDGARLLRRAESQGTTDDAIYITGFSDDERKRLIEQAANDDRSTGQLFGDAGIGTGTEDPMTATMTRTENLAPTDVVKPARHGWPAFAMALGLLLVLTAGGLLAAGGSRTAVVPDSTLTPFPTVGTATSTYEPGHTSGWHVHPGVHSVVVLSGTLTIYDESCVRTDYGPGQTYLGGATPHVARNETLDVLDVAITFVYRRADENPGRAVPAPTGCELR